jgi:glycosyltransferase involved in cell wall biosynthesis
MSILLHPALEEACPMAILESMALGLPVVAGIRSGGVPWVLDEGRAGFLTDVRKPQRMTETLLKCITQPNLRTSKQDDAYRRVLDIFSPESVARQYEQLYGQAVAF